MGEEQAGNRYGVTPGKLTLIGLLSIVLVVVVYWNFFHEAGLNVAVRNEYGANVDANNGRKAQRNNKRRSSGRMPPNDHVRLHAKPWPEYKLAEVVSYNPFALPDAFPRPREVVADAVGTVVAPSMSDAEKAAQRLAAAQLRAAALAAIRAKGVQVILQNGQEYIAVIDGREIRVNDNLNGYTVVHIGNDGITLEGEMQ